MINEDVSMKRSLKMYEDIMSDWSKSLNKWMTTKAELGGGKYWDFVNGYYGEKIKSKVKFDVLLAWATEGGKITRNSGLECLKVENRKEMN